MKKTFKVIIFSNQHNVNLNYLELTLKNFEIFAIIFLFSIQILGKIQQIFSNRDARFFFSYFRINLALD